MMKKIALYAFKGEKMCFMHVLLNAVDMSSKDIEVKIVIEGEAVKLVEQFIKSKNPLFSKANRMGVIDCVCKACSVKFGVLEYNEKSGIRLSGEMNGHPPMESYLKDGFEIITL